MYNPDHDNYCFCFQDHKLNVQDTMILSTLFVIVKTNNFRGVLTDTILYAKQINWRHALSPLAADGTAMSFAQRCACRSWTSLFVWYLLGRAVHAILARGAVPLIELTKYTSVQMILFRPVDLCGLRGSDSVCVFGGSIAGPDTERGCGGCTHIRWVACHSVKCLFRMMWSEHLTFP